MPIFQYQFGEGIGAPFASNLGSSWSSLSESLWYLAHSQGAWMQSSDPIGEASGSSFIWSIGWYVPIHSGIGAVT